MSYTQRTAIGLMAGPLMPPVLKSRTGFFDAMSISMPGPTVFIAVMPSAPACSAAFAIVLMFSTFGESLTITGIFTCFFTVVISSFRSFGSDAYGFSWVTFGHEGFSSIIPAPAISPFLATCAISWGVSPIVFRIRGMFFCLVFFISSVNASMPGFERPTAFISPFSYAMTVGFLWPCLGAMLMDFVVTAAAPELYARIIVECETPRMPALRTNGFLRSCLRKDVFIIMLTHYEIIETQEFIYVCELLRCCKVFL